MAIQCYSLGVEDPKLTFEELMEAIRQTQELTSRMQLKAEKELGALIRSVRNLVRYRPKSGS